MKNITVQKKEKTESAKGACLIGIISDTHGLLRPEVIKALEGVSLIIHAGDIGSQTVLDLLENIAPVVSVRGNTDKDTWACRLPLMEVVEIGDISIYVLHDLCKLDLDPSASGFNAVIHGHTHQPEIKDNNSILFLNPGSAGPKRFTLPVSIALLHIEDNSLRAELRTLTV